MIDSARGTVNGNDLRYALLTSAEEFIELFKTSGKPGHFKSADRLQQLAALADPDSVYEFVLQRKGPVDAT